MHKIFKIIWKIVKIIFVVIISLYLVFIVLNKISENTSIFGYRVLTITNSTMNKEYSINDVILVKECNNKKLKAGDDITYKGISGGYNNTLVTSRLEKIEVDSKGVNTYTTKGISSVVSDPSISDEQIVGKVVFVIPFISQLHKIFKLPLGYTLFIFLPLFIIIAYEILETLKRMKEDVSITRRLEIISSKIKNRKRVKESDKGEIEILEDFVHKESTKNKNKNKKSGEPKIIQIIDDEII